MYYLSRLLSNYAFSYMKSYLLLSFILILIGYKFKYKYFLITGIIILFSILYFYRIPSMNIIKDDSYLFSPCFGKIARISPANNNMLQISIYIRLKDPHIQYVPYNGIIQNQMYKKGEFYPAHMMKKSKYNERLIHNIQTNKGLITVVQIGGIIARSIVKFVNKGDLVEQNQELGLIGISGSRVDVFIPLENKFNILVKEGDKVTNKTPLLQFMNI